MEVLAVGAGSINRGWGVSFLLAIATLTVIWFAVPGTKELVVGKDGRWSTSKFQAIAWTLVILFALFSLFWAYAIVQFGDLVDWKMLARLEDPLGGGFDDFFAAKFDETYLVLLGLPLGTAVVTKAITTAKIANGTEVKPPKHEGDETGAVQELVGNDRGETELTDFQYLLFNLLAIAYFLVAFMSHPAAGLPALPDTLVALTGVAAAAYIGKKGVYKEPPILLGVMPPSARPGEQIDVYGQQLLTSADTGEIVGAAPVAGAVPPPVPGAGPAPAAVGTMVVIGGHVAKVVGQPSETKVTVEVPEIPAGAMSLSVLRPPGASSDALPFTVLAPA
ncbi:MAG TPA: IPT/TIG domain-containing protein [Solirubrobacterales bacterium]|nr:IPT/TIG domain-containing protein [Solirubrobacterales bacterium]